jgi:hypothetical protein
MTAELDDKPVAGIQCGQDIDTSTICHAVTGCSCHGLSAERILIHPDISTPPDLLSSRLGYLAASHASHEATIFTDDVTRLGQRLRTEVSKTSALEIPPQPLDRSRAGNGSIAMLALRSFREDRSLESGDSVFSRK